MAWTDQLDPDLDRVGSLRVVSRTSVMQLQRNQRNHVPEIARGLKPWTPSFKGWSHSFGPACARRRAAAASARRPTHLGRHLRSRTVANVLKLQEELAGAIAQQVQDADRFQRSRNEMGQQGT